MRMPILILLSLLLAGAAVAHFGAKFEPPDGRIYHGSGWNYIDSHRRYEEMFPGDKRPLILQTNVSIPGTRGTDVARLVRGMEQMIIHPDSQFVEFSMHWQGRDAAVMLDSIYVHTDQWDRYVDTLEIAFRRVNRPFFLRLGFEFNGDWNPYHPYIFPQAFRKLVIELRRRGIDQFATVWCYEPDAPGDFADSTRQGWKWYPGDDVVDWFGLDLFNHAHFDPAEPDSQRGQLSRKGKSEAFLRFAETRGKPVFLNELSAIDIQATPDSLDEDHADGRADWEVWFEPFFDFVAAHPIIKGWNYINVDWNVVGDYGEMGWRDARLEINTYIRERWVAQVSGDRFIHAGWDITQDLGVRDGRAPLPRLMSFEAWPNPFNAQMRIAFDLPHSGIVRLMLFDPSGREAGTLLGSRWLSAGRNGLTLDGGALPAGSYMLRLDAGGWQAERKVVMIK